MQIDLNQKITEHLERLEDLAKEAADDDGEKYSSRASAFNSLSSMLRELVKSQAEVINMERMMRIEATTIEILREFLTPDQHILFLQRLEDRLQNDQTVSEQN